MQCVTITIDDNLVAENAIDAVTTGHGSANRSEAVGDLARCLAIKAQSGDRGRAGTLSDIYVNADRELPKRMTRDCHPNQGPRRHRTCIDMTVCRPQKDADREQL
jgi:metal-responsive CopG/Arc/MetJ family transcriptional regulator